MLRPPPRTLPSPEPLSPTFLSIRHRESSIFSKAFANISILLNPRQECVSEKCTVLITYAWLERDMHII